MGDEGVGVFVGGLVKEPDGGEGELILAEELDEGGDVGVGREELAVAEGGKKGVEGWGGEGEFVGGEVDAGEEDANEVAVGLFELEVEAEVGGEDVGEGEGGMGEGGGVGDEVVFAVGEEGGEDVLFGGEVVVNSALTDVGGLGDLIDGGLGEAEFGEEADGGSEDAEAGGVFFAEKPGRGRSDHGQE